MADIDTISVDVSRHKGNSYRLQLQFTANAPVQRVVALLTDYDQLTRLNPTIISTRRLATSDHSTSRVEIVARGCMLFFCRKVQRVDDVSIISPYRIESVIIPSLSDFKSGSTIWRFVPHQSQTIVHYQATLVPDFWVPPLIGPRALKKQIRNQLEKTARTVNQILGSGTDG